MKIKTLNFTQKWVLPYAVASLAIPCAMGQQASTIQWDGGGATGNWSDTTWIDADTVTVRNPVAGDLVGFIGASAIITIDEDTPILEQMVVQDGFTLEIDNFIDVEGTDLVDNPDPTPDTPASGFFLREGTLNVNDGGGLYVNQGGNFDIGLESNGELNLVTGGEILTDRPMVIGRGGAGTGTFNMSGGLFSHTGADMKFGGWGSDVTWNLSGGTAEIQSLRFGFGNTNGIGEAYQTGGTLTLTQGNNSIGWASFDGSSFTYNLSAGTFEVISNRLRLGVAGKGNYSNNLIQTGGTLTIDDRLDINEAGDATAVGTSTYDISGGTATISNGIFVGAFGTEGSGVLNVSGTADLETADILIGNGKKGTVNVSGGEVTALGRIRIGSNTGSTETNQFNLTGGTVVTFSRVDLGEEANGTNELNISGGSLSLNGSDQRILIGFQQSGTGIVNLSGTGVLEAGSVVLAEDVGLLGAKGTLNLNGGTLITDLIKVGLGDTAEQTLNLNGSTIQAKTLDCTFISANITTANLMAGGVTFDTAGFDVPTSGVMTGPGGITKTGLGTLTVNSVQAYTGATRVEQGTLNLIEPFLSPTGDVYLTSGAALNLTSAADQAIGNLYIDGVLQPIDTYGPTGSGASVEIPELTGAGTLTSSATSTADLEIVSITRSGTTATIVITGAPSTEYVCTSSLTLSGFTPIATTPATIMTDGSGDATFTVDATENSKFYIVEDAP